MVLYLGIDAGGTASKARLVDANGLRLGAGKAGPANTRIGLDALHRSLLDACTQALKDGGVADSDYGSVRVGMVISGINRMGMKQQIPELEFHFDTVPFTRYSNIATR